MGTLQQLNTVQFNLAVAQMGEVPAAWYRRIGPCPRHQVAGARAGGADYSGNADPLTEVCPLCANTFSIYERQALPLTGPTLGKLLLQNAHDRNKKTPVVLEGGEQICTFLRTDYPLGEGDRIILRSRAYPFEQRVKRATSPGGVPLPTGGDDLTRTPARAIEAVYGQDGKITSGFALDGAGHQLVWTDYPGSGSHYTVRYTFYPTYAVLAGSIHHRVEATNGDPFPSRCILKLWDNRALDVKASDF